MEHWTTQACFLFASLLSAAGAATVRPATDAEYRSIRETLKAQYANGGTAKLREVVVGQDKGQPSGKVQHVCGDANTTRFYGTVSKKDDGKPYVTILGTEEIADTMCAEKLGI